MNKTIIILKHEFWQMIRRKVFIIMTVIFPVLALLGILGYTIIQGMERGPEEPAEITNVGYVDEVGTFDKLTEGAEISFISYPDEERAKAALLSGEIEEYFILPTDYIDIGIIIRYTTEKELEMPSEIRWQVRSFLLNNLLGDEVGQEILQRVENPMRGIITTRLDESGQPATEQGGFGSLIAPSVFAILLMVSIFTSSGYLLQGMTEEKESRVMEILLSSVTPRQLLTGKILGLGAAGLLQVLIWLASAMGVIQLASTQIGGIMSSISFPSNFLILGITYFILGYLLFAILMATIGAVATTRETTQIAGIFTASAMVPLWLSGLIISNPDHAVVKVFTFIPTTAPVTVMMRLGLTDIPPWELGLSIALLVTAIWIALTLAAKILRTFLLMYGKQPGIRQIVKYLREA